MGQFGFRAIVPSLRAVTMCAQACPASALGSAPGTYKSVIGGIVLLGRTNVDADALLNYVRWGPVLGIVSVISK